ncbi:MAG: hypothetical protein S4CHLAM123_09100 [Chlamydiales bacterium]|nr:hypothetical protein [Chlamydiales bacterium]
MTKVSNQPIPTNMQVVAKYVKKGACVVGTLAGSAIVHEDLFADWDATVGFNASPWIGGVLTTVSAGLFYTTLGQKPKALEEKKSINLLEQDDTELELEKLFKEKKPKNLLDQDDTELGLKEIFKEKTIIPAEKSSENGVSAILGEKPSFDKKRSSKSSASRFFMNLNNRLFWKKSSTESAEEKLVQENKQSANATKQGAGLFNEHELYNLQDFKNLEQEERLNVEEKSANIEELNLKKQENSSYKGMKISKDYKSFVKNLYQELAVHETKPWLEEDVLAVADSLFKLAEEVSIGLPDYLPGFLERLEKNGINQSVTDALTQEENELYPTAYYLPFVYHMIRSGVCRKGEIGGLKLPGVIAKSTSSPFYEEGTSQHEWRETYNSYCEKMRKDLDPESDLYKLLEPDVSAENYVKVNRTSYPEKVTRSFDDHFAFKL